ncbi:MAG: hypothetical protein ACM3JB_10085 [Acidobacteriaceae bacterium]
MPQQHSRIAEQQRNIVLVIISGQITIAQEANDGGLLAWEMFLDEIEQPFGVRLINR